MELSPEEYLKITSEIIDLREFIAKAAAEVTDENKLHYFEKVPGHTPILTVELNGGRSQLLVVPNNHLHTHEYVNLWKVLKHISN